jgi:hypothetical protein
MHGNCYERSVLIDSIEKKRDILEFREKPFISGEYVIIMATAEFKKIRCRVSVNTIEQLSRSQDDPLILFENHRLKIEAIFIKLYELELYDEEGGITFSTSPVPIK